MNVHQPEPLTRPSTLLQPAINTSAFLKMGLTGFQGDGKTKTAGKVAIGLWHYLRKCGAPEAGRPVAMFDTEKGSDFLIPDFEEAGIPFHVAKKRSFADKLTVMDEAVDKCSILIIDSVTHTWRELMASYLKEKNTDFMGMDDWNYLKGDKGWKRYTDRFLNMPLHIIMCGRAGDEYETYIENGRRKIEVVGTKMKTEGETGFEPDLNVLMSSVQNQRDKKITIFATVTKDRWDKINGHVFEMPKFENFLPHIGLLAIGGRHVGQATGDSRHIITTEKRDWSPVQRRIVHDEIKDLLLLHFPGQTAQEKTGKVRALLDAFNASWAEIDEVMSLPDLRAGYDKLHVAMTGRPSKYASAIVKDAESTDLNDSLPDSFAPIAAATTAVVDTVTVNPNGIPAFLDRTAPAAPAEPEFDEPRWLADLTSAFGECVDFVSFGEKQQTLMAPVKPKVTKASWNKAVKIATACVARLAEQPGGVGLAAE